MGLPIITVIAQRHQNDCAVACLAMICATTYEKAAMAFSHNVFRTGASVSQIQAAAKKLRRPLRWSTKVANLETETGILWVSSKQFGKDDHVVVFKEEQVFNTDSTVWDYDVYMAAYEAWPTGILKLEGE